jgi:hypothetical protein
VPPRLTISTYSSDSDLVTAPLKKTLAIWTSGRLGGAAVAVGAGTGEWVGVGWGLGVAVAVGDGVTVGGGVGVRVGVVVAAGVRAACGEGAAVGETVGVAVGAGRVCCGSRGLWGLGGARLLAQERRPGWAAVEAVLLPLVGQDDPVSRRHDLGVHHLRQRAS